MIADPVTTITLTAGTPQSVKFASSYPFYWIDNKTSGNVYARIGGTPAPDSDGTFTIAAGSQLRVSGGAFDNDITLLGSGKVQIIASELASCPFKLGAKGGGNELSGASSYSVDAVDYPLLGLNLFGRSVQDGTPTPDAPVNIVSVGDNGFDIISKDDTHFNLLSVRDSGGDIITKQPVSTVVKIGEKATFTVAASGTGLKYQWQWSADGGKTWKNTSTTAASYSLTAIAAYNGYMYRCVVTDSNGNFETSNESTLYVVSDDCEVKTASIATDALPWCGIPVESGGNYTDSNGQQWICDELIYNADGTGKIVKKCNKLKLAAANITGFVEHTTLGNYFNTNIESVTVDEQSSLRPISNVFEGVKFSDRANSDYINKFRCFSTSNGKIIIRNSALENDKFASLADMQNFVDTNDVYVLYPIAEPQEIELTAAEMTAFRQLKTFNGTTRISNNGDADMSVKYCTNKALSEYVLPITKGLQKQIDELRAAVLSLGGNV